MPATLVVMAGLPGTGKSAIAAQLGGVVLNKDYVRAALFPPELVEYSPSQDDLVVSLLLQTAEYLFARGQSRIILDGRTHSRRYQVDTVRAFASARRIRCIVIECVCPPETAIARIEADINHPAKNRDAALYWRQRESWEEIQPPKTVIDTSRPLDECLRVARAALAL